MTDFNLQILVDHIPEALVVLSPSDTVVFFNRKAAEFQRIVKNFSIGSAFLDIIPGERKPIVTQVLESVRLTLTTQVVEIEFVDDNGKVFFFESVYEPVINDRRLLEFTCVYFREKTFERIFEKRSTQLLHQYSSLIENANAVIFSIDSHQYITDWNQESVRLTGFEKDDVFARRIEELLDEKQVKPFSDFISDARRGTSPVNFELILKRRGGEGVVTILLNATPKRNPSGDIIGVLFVGHDVTELWEYRRSLEEQIEDRTLKLRQALEKEKELVDLKNRFVSMASHEFRMPLSTITSSVNSVRANATLRESDLEKLGIIERQITHMRSLIDDVLTVGKSEASKLTASRQLLDLTAFLKNIVVEVTGSQGSHHVDFNCSHGSFEMMSDEKLLRNIFINLLTNAIKFSPASRTVDMIMRVEKRDVQVTVRDYGIGIKPEDVDRVFTPFNRGSNTGSIKGTGLGLSIVKRATETLGGFIHVESIPGKGTTMTVRLPIIMIEN